MLLSATILAPASADTLGVIGVTLNITNACVINGAGALQANAGSLGTITFPDQPGIFGDVDTSLLASGSGGALSILCSPGARPLLSFGAGDNDSGGRHRLAYNGNSVAYRIYSDAARQNEIAVGAQLTLPVATTAAASVPVYARVNSGGTVLPAGTYTDTLHVTLSW